MYSLHLHTLPLSLPIPKPLLKPYSSTFPATAAPFRRRPRPPHTYASDEFPVGDDDAYLSSILPKEKESEDEARRRNWIERGWAPWEEILTPEANFARKSLNEGEEVPLQTPEAIEAFRMLSPKYRKQKIKDMGLTEDEYLAKQFEMKGEIPDPLETSWSGPLVLGMVPPRDWPPRGWEVDREELEFIRGAHKVFSSMRVDVENLEEKVEEGAGEDQMCLERYKMFLKQYCEWVEANKDRMKEESYKYDQDYHPGRRKRGKDYKEGMYELPFYYPGQVCYGKVTALHLYQGAFVDIGGVYDGLVLIKRNDWYWIRHHIKVGMPVLVEILAKRDPYRYRFPIELRLVYPNIDHLIFNKFDFPPIFHRDEDTNPDELRRDCGRPPVPRKDYGIKWEEEPLLSNHPYCDKLWQIHNAEQMILDDMMANPDKYAGKKLTELADAEDFDEEKIVEYGEAHFNKALLPKMILKVSVKELNLEAALAEREHHEKLRKEAEARGEKYKIKILRRNQEMNDYDFLHWRRSVEEREALLRDISCRQALGLPLEEPGRYLDPKLAKKDEYDPNNPLYRYDYWGEPKNSEKSKEERMTDAHNKSIVGKGTVWYEMSYEDAIEQKQKMEAMGIEPRQYDEDESESNHDDDSDDEEDDLIYSILTSPPSANVANQPHVNGTESSRLTDEGLFED